MQCFFCQGSLSTSEKGLTSCTKCGQVQILAPANPFEILGAPVRFDLDERALEDRYYQLSRVLHPDRFGGASHDVREAARRNAAEVNTAYDALKTKEARLDTLLERLGAIIAEDQGTEKGAGSAIPQEWAERFFDLDDESDRENFAQDLSKEIQSSTNKLLGWAGGIDWGKAQKSDPEVTDIVKERKRRAYLRSLLRQVQS